MSSKYLDIPGRKGVSASSDDDDHSFIILSSSAANSLSYDREIEFLSHPSSSTKSPIRENVSILDDTDLETLINAELDDKDNDFNSIPEICESLMATIRPGSVISLEDNYSNVLRENLEEIVMRFKQLTDHLQMTRELLNSQLKLRRDLLEKSKEVVQATRMIERLQEENQLLLKELEINKNKNYHLLKKFKNLRETESEEVSNTKKMTKPSLVGNVFKIIFVVLLVLVLLRLIYFITMNR